MTDKEMEMLRVSQCPSVDWCKGYNFAVEKANEIINHQHSEIETMLKDLQFRTNQVIEQEANIERLRTECRNQSTLWSKHFEDMFETTKEFVRTEAIKEFAERLKNECSFETDVSLGYGRPCYEDAIPIIAIDNLVKEMVGEE